MRVKLVEWIATGAIIGLLLVSVLLYGWRYLRLEGRVDGVPAAEAAGLPEQASPATVYVHVTGAVNKSGVYQLPEGARIFEAIAAAGGATDGALVDQLNLAERIADGDKVVVPSRDDETESKLDVNKATSSQLESLPGIGPTLARSIVEYRKVNGPFRQIDDLLKVHGMKSSTLGKIKPFIAV